MLWACSLSNYKIYTYYIPKAYILFISRVYLTSPQNILPQRNMQPSEYCSQNALTAIIPVLLINDEIWNQQLNSHQGHAHVDTTFPSETDVLLFEAQFLGPFLYWEVSPRCCCWKAFTDLCICLRWQDMTSLLSSERWHKCSRKCNFTAWRPLLSPWQ